MRVIILVKETNQLLSFLFRREVTNQLFLLLLLERNDKPVEADHIEHNVDQNSKQEVRRKPHQRLVHERVVEAVHPYPNRQTLRVHLQQAHTHGAEDMRHVLEMTQTKNAYAEGDVAATQHKHADRNRSAADEVEEVIADTLVSRQLVQNPLVRRIPVGSDRDRMSLSPHGHDHIVVLDTHERQGRRNTDVLEGNTKIARFA